MRYVFALWAVVVGLVVLFVAVDPAYQRMRADRAWYRSQQQALDLEWRRLELDERRAVSSVVVGADGTLRVLVVVALLGVGVGLVDWYCNRRRPLVRPDARGLLPVGRDELLSSSQLAGELARLNQHVQALRAVHQPGQVPAQLQYAPSLAVRAAERPSVLNPTEDTPSPLLLPSAPSWVDLRAAGWSPSSGRLLLGYAAAGPLYGSVADLLSTAIAGRPGQGKSTLLRFIYLQVAAIGGSAVVWDLHGSVAEDVPGLPVCETVAQIEQSAQRVLAELDRRIVSHGASVPMLVLVDEWPALSLASRAAGRAVARLVLEGRKAGVYALIAGQGLPADRFGGSLVRDALSSRYVFRTTVAQARMAGLDRDALDVVPQLQPGRAVLAGPVEPQVVAIPFVTVRDVEACVLPSGSTLEAQHDAVEVPEVDRLSPEQLRAEVLRRRAAGETKTATILALWGVSGGRAFQTASAAYDSLLG